MLLSRKIVLLMTADEYNETELFFPLPLYEEIKIKPFFSPYRSLNIHFQFSLTEKENHLLKYHFPSHRRLKEQATPEADFYKQDAFFRKLHNKWIKNVHSKPDFIFILVCTIIYT